MAEFFKTSALWVVDFRYDGQARRWFRAFDASEPVRQKVVEQLRDLYGDRAQLVSARLASVDEENLYLRGDEPKTMLCPTGRR